MKKLKIMLNINQIIEEIKKTGKFGEKPIFSREDLQNFEASLKFTFPEEYKNIVSTLEPEIANFYFIKPYRHPIKKNYIIFAEWTEDRFAFNENDYSIVTILDNDDTGKKWNQFIDWVRYVWDMSNKPINPE